MCDGCVAVGLGDEAADLQTVQCEINASTRHSERLAKDFE